MLSLLAGCQPALNWREVHPAGSGAVAMFPCKPDVEQRKAMGLAQCETGGRGFALSWAEVPDATQVGAALKAMPQALASKLGRPLPPGVALQVPGMTPTPEAAQYVLQSASAVTRVAVFAHGGRVYQALMTVQKDDPAAWEVFRTGLALEAAR
jgi:phage tail protein X